jgi:hypothetical protein
MLIDLILPLTIIAIIGVSSDYLIKSSKEKKTDSIRSLVKVYEKDCRENSKDLVSIKDKFIKTSSKNSCATKDLHQKTLEILSGEKFNV